MASSSSKDVTKMSPEELGEWFRGFSCDLAQQNGGAVPPQLQRSSIVANGVVSKAKTEEKPEPVIEWYPDSL